MIISPLVAFLSNWNDISNADGLQIALGSPQARFGMPLRRLVAVLKRLLDALGRVLGV